jgi:adenine-specific DNA-methyltransferase
MDKLKMNSLNNIDKNIKKIAELFPNTLTEVIKGYHDDGSPRIEHAIDFDILRQELSNEVVDGPTERYQFTWPDKRKSILLANSPIYKTLRPCREESVDFDTTKNLYIEGDNLDALKLLQETYLGKVKMIYIDPPYNTGKDKFIYDDCFDMDGTIFSALSGQYDENGNMLFDIRENDENNGRFHTDWLNMIYPRLKIAKDFLTEDGVIFVSIDEKEITNMTKICDEIFGKQNHLETFHIQVRYANKSLNEDNDFQPVMEYILIYARNSKLFKPNKPSEPYDLSKFAYSFNELTEGETVNIGNKTVSIFKAGEWEVNKSEKGRVGLLKETWASGSIVRQSGTAAEFLSKYLIDRKPIDGLGVLYKIHNMGEDGLGYRYVTGPLKQEAIRGKFYSGVPLERVEEIKSGTSLKYRPIVNFYNYSGDFGNIRHEGNIAFNSGKKPIKMLQHLLYTANLKPTDIVMDFFSGSASLAHSVLQYNIKYEYNIKFIMVQLPEETDEKSDAYKSGFKNICEIGKERIRRASKIIKDEAGLTGQNLDIGFRVLKIDSTNMEDVYYNPDEYQQTILGNLVDNVKPDRTAEDLLFQVMLDLGILLSSTIEEHLVDGKQVFNVSDGYLLACFDADVTSDTVIEIAKQKPYYAVFRDSSMANDSVATNFEQIFNTYSPTTVRKVL